MVALTIITLNLVGLGLAQALAAEGAMAADKAAYLTRPPEDEVIYFLLPDRFENGDPSNDRGGLSGGPLQTGYDPTQKGFYLGGDLKGVLSRLDYIQGLGATAIWLAPVFKNKPVQGPPGHESAGYHGYWITDFTDVDPHFGTKADLKALVDAAHSRGMKVYLDIVVNHTADIIKYRECAGAQCVYRSEADYPYSTKGGVNGAPINVGFEGVDKAHQTLENFSKLTRPDYAYTPYVPAGEEHAKTPGWLNDPIYYHNRGQTTYRGESGLNGDFSGLDDLFTENPRVVQGFIDIYGAWIDAFGIDGYRIDTARHVNAEFWQAFIPAMLARAKAKGIENFHIFGEVADPDPAVLARFTHDDAYPAVLDLALQAKLSDVLIRDAPTLELATLFADDVLFKGGAEAALHLPTFISNHDMGRFAFAIRKAHPKMASAEVMRRVVLGYAFLFFSRGQPIIYAGDEQGFVGLGDDQAARQPLFASKVASYNSQALLGTSSTTAQANFNPDHPIYRALAQMAAVRRADRALRRGLQTVRAAGDGPGLFALSRRVPGEAGETLIVFNTSDRPITGQIRIDYASADWISEHGACAPHASAPGSYGVKLGALDYLVCRSAGRGQKP